MSSSPPSWNTAGLPIIEAAGSPHAPPSNKRMHATADTLPVIYLQSLGAARDARRWAAVGGTEISGIGGPCPHARKQLRMAGGA